MTPVRIDHRQEGYDRLLEVFKDKPNIIALINIYLKQNDDIESVIFQLLNSRHLSELDTVVGEQLDIIGEIVGQERMGDTDEEYRKYILLRIGVNNSQATQGYITNLLKGTTESTEVNYFPHYPASYIAEFNGDYIPRNFLTEFQNSTVAGVNAGFIHNKDDLGLICCEVGSTDPIADKSILPEYTALTGNSASEIYMKNVNPVGGVPVEPKGEKLKQAFAITQHVGDSSSTLTVDTGLNLVTSNSLLLYWSDMPDRPYNFTPLFSTYSGATGGQREWYNGFIGQSTNIYCDISYTTTGFTEPSTATTSYINETGFKYSVHTLRSVPEVLDIFEYTGDGSLSKYIPHSLAKTPLFMAIQTKDGGKGITFWYKGMDNDEVYNNGSPTTIGAILGGSTPTSTGITVGDIGGTFSPNADGEEYIVLLLADNPDEGITGGSYMSTGVGGQEVDIGNSVGLLNIRGTDASRDILFSSPTGLYGKISNATAPSTGYLQQIDVDNSKILLESDNAYTNPSSPQKFYWFNIADPNSTIN